MKLDLLTIGDCSIDLYMKIADEAFGVESETSESPKICFYHGSKIKASQYKSFVAGNACNVAVGAKTLGLNVGVYTELGSDDNAEQFFKEFRVIGVDSTFCVKNKNSPTNVHTVLVYGNDRTIITYHEKRQYKMPDLEKAGSPKWIYYTSLSDGFESFQKELVTYLKANPNVGVGFNPGTIQLEKGVDGIKNILEITDILFLNKEETTRLVGEDTIDKLHQKLQALGPKLTVITDGTNGSTAYEGNKLYKQVAIPLEKSMVDKTGAGDAFSSGFLSAIFYGKNISEALLYGSLNSANVITQLGAVNGLLDLKSLQNKLVK